MQFMRPNPSNADMRRIKDRGYWAPGSVLNKVPYATTAVSPSEIGSVPVFLDFYREMFTPKLWSSQRFGVAFLMWKGTVRNYTRPIQLRMSVATWEESGASPSSKEWKVSLLTVASTTPSPSNYLDAAPDAQDLFAEAAELPPNMRLSGVFVGRQDAQSKAAFRKMFLSELMPPHLLKASDSERILLKNGGFEGDPDATCKFMWPLPVVYDTADGSVTLDLDYLRIHVIGEEDFQAAISSKRIWGSFSRFDSFFHAASGNNVSFAKAPEDPFEYEDYDRVWSLLA